MTEFSNSKDEQSKVSSLISVSFISIYINKMLKYEGTLKNESSQKMNARKKLEHLKK